MPTSLSMCQAALSRIGATPIASFEDPGAEAEVAGNNYGPVKRGVLALHPWRRAMNTAKLDTPLADSPYAPWTTAWQLPADALKLWNVRDAAAGWVQTFDIQGDKILTERPDPILLDYTWDVDESLIEPHVEELIILRLAALFARGVADRDSMGAAFDQAAEVQFRRAKNIDSQGRTPQAIQLGRYRRIR